MSIRILHGFCFAVIVFFTGASLSSCGQRLSETATTSTTSTSTTSTSTTSSTTSTSTTSTTTTTQAGVMSGQILVPASSISGLSISIAAINALATAEDGVSDTPLGSAQVMACDPVTGIQLTGTTTSNADADGNYTVDLTGATLPAGQILIKAFKTVGSNTIVVKTIAATNEPANINTKTTLSCSKVLEELSKKAGDLLGKASSLSSADKAGLHSIMESIFSSVRGNIGTLSAQSVPPLIYNNSGLGLNDLEKLQFETLSSTLGAVFTPPSGWTNMLTNFYDAATAVATSAAYPAGLQLPIGFNDFVLPQGMTLPTGAKFGYSPMGDSFIPPAFRSGLPPSAFFGSGFVPPTGLVFPSGVSLGSGFDLPPLFIDALPANAFLFSGCDLPSGINMPINADFQSGFVVPSGVIMQSGFIMPTYANFGSGYVLPPSGLNFNSGFVVPSGVAMGSGFVMPTGMNFGAGYQLPPSGIDFQDGFTMPTGITFQSGFTMPSGVTFQPGFTMPPNVGFESGFTMPSGVSFGSGFVMPSGVSFQPGFVMPSGVSFGSGFVPPSGMSYQSGFQQPSGWTPPSGFVQPSGWLSGAPPSGSGF